jgi:hypothetical protein
VGFGDHEFYPGLIDKAAVLLERLAGEWEIRAWLNAHLTPTLPRSVRVAPTWRGRRDK